MIRLIAVLAIAMLGAGFAPAGAAGAAGDREASVAEFAATIRQMRQGGVIPIIDVELHWSGKLAIADLIRKMDRNGVALTWLGPGEKQGSGHSVKMNRQFPGRIVPTTVHGDGPLWHGRDRGFLDKLGEDVRSGEYFAMGEFEARHYVSSTNNRDVHLPLTSESFETVFRLSAETGTPFLVHHEAEDSLLPEMETMLAKYPNAKVVWCHVGRNRNPNTWTKFRGPAAVRELLARHPNLYFDLVQSRPGSKYGPTGYVDAVMYETEGGDVRLKSAWRQLLIDYSDRFVIGTDVNFGRWENYDIVITTFRGVVFRELPLAVVEKIAYKNAWQLMTGSAWADDAE